MNRVSFLLLSEDGGIVLGADNTVVAVWPCNLAPDHLQQLLSRPLNFPFERTYPNLGALDLTLRTVDESYPLSEVESGILLCVDTLDLYKRGVGVGVPLAALVRQVLPLRSEHQSPFQQAFTSWPPP